MVEKLFAGGGEMGALMRSLDWSQTLLGPVSEWAQSLKTALSIILTSRYPMFIWWGAEYANLYNDAYRPILGATKHPQFLGQSAKDCWADVWDVVGPLADSVLTTGQPTWSEDLLLLMERNGYLEETYFTFSYSPVRDESGGVGGVFCAVTETTGRLIGERRLRTLRELAAKTAEAKTVEEACHLATTTLSINPHDIPFALLYRVEPDGNQARLAGTTGIAAGTLASPQQVNLSQKSEVDRWNLARVNRTGIAELVRDLPQRFGVLPQGVWSDAPTEALVIPIAQSGKAQGGGLLVVGISPRREFDDDYRGFCDLIASNVATAIANADAYEAERQRAAALAELDRAKTTFFSNISHEFRTPLTLMLGSVEATLTGNEPLSSHQREQLEAAQRNSLRLLKLVNTLLDFSRIEAGRIQAVYAPTDLATFTRELASVFRSAIERAGMQLVVECTPLPEPIYVDREMWEKIVLNLLSNAFKFTFEGTITVALRFGTDHVELDVRDTGIGIPEHELPRLFERFHRIPGVRGRTYEGSGIGLSLVEELVRLHGGTLGVTSREGQGSCFTVSIPTGFVHLPQERIEATQNLTSTATQVAAYVEEALRWLPEAGSGEWGIGTREVEAALPMNNPSLTTGNPTPDSRLPTPSPARILLVDDNADMRDYVRRLLSRDYEVEAVSDGLAALDAMQRHLPDLVVADVMMPRLDGLELLRSLRNDSVTQNIPIILLSARAGEESRVEGLEAGADDYLVKPFSARELLACVRTNLELSRLRREAVRYQEQLRVEAQAAQQRVSTILESITDAFVAFDRKWRYTYVNEQATRLLHKTREQLLGKRVWEEVFPETGGTLMHHELHRAMSEQVAVVFEDFSPTLGFWMEVHAYPAQEGLALYFQDITDRKQAELEIRKFVSLADNSTEFIGMCDMNFVPFYVNEAGRQMVGLDHTQQYRETPVREFFFPEDQDFIIDEFFPLVLREKRAEVEIRFRHFKTGEALWMIYNVFYITGENNQPIGLATVSRNITDRKRAEVALRESESRFRNIADHSPIMIWISAPDGAGVWFNQQWCEFTGQTLEEALGSGWLAVVHPEDALAIETTCLQAHAQHEPVRLEYRLRRHDGEYRWVFDSAVPRFDDTGVYLGYIGSIIDISDRKLAQAELERREQEFRAVVENTPDLIVRYDCSGRHLYVNPSLERALGIPSEQFIGRTAIEMGFTDATSQAWNAVLQQVLVSAQDSTFEYEFPNPEGESRSYQAYFVPEFVQDGEVKTVLTVVRDVTEYKRTQEALRQSEERYRLALQAGRMVAWAWDAKTDKMIYSQTACEVIGLRREALQGTGSQGWQRVHPEDLAQHQATVQAAIDSKGSYISKFRIIRPDNGRVIWLEDRGKVNVDAMGHLISIEGTLFDISDAYRQAVQRKQAQQELQQTLQTLTTLINASPLPIVVIQPNMTVQLWNPAAEQLFGWSEAEVIGQPIPIVSEEKRDECRQVREAVMRGEIFTDVETYRCQRDGSMVIVSISAAPLYNELGSLNAILLIFQDITQRQQSEEALRQSEERLRLALLVGKAGIWDWDIPQNRVTWSEQIYEFHGLAPGSFGGRVEDFAQLVHPGDRARVSEAIDQALEGKASYELEFRVVQPNGEVRWLSTTGGVIWDEQGLPIRMLGATRDITERKAVDEEREQLLLSEQRAREEAERANRIKDEFLAVLSHELRSPLNPILGWAKLLQSRTLDEQKIKHALATIERNALLQTQLIDDLLDVSRILRGKLVLSAVPVNLASTIEAALETVRLAADAKDIHIQRVLDPNVGQVMGESARLQQVIWNLLSNAVKFTPSGGTIEIRLEEVGNWESRVGNREPGIASRELGIGNREITPYSLLPTSYSPTHAQIQIKDMGKGINPEFLPHVFEYFRQEDGTTTRKFGGLGLGLAIVRHLVELHGGTVWAESPGEGLGATFTVRLPLMPASPPTRQDNPPATPVAHLTGLRILVVDDQPDIRDIVAFILEQAGAVVRVAASAAEALNFIEQSLPDVLICDIGMPEIDGYMLMRQMRTLPAEQGGSVPAIALTAYAGEVDQQQALAAGFQQHIAKPVEPEALVRAIAHLVQLPQST